MNQPKIRVQKYKDGRQELIKLLSIDGLSEQSLDDPLTFEKSVMWLEDITDLKFVRVGQVKNAQSRRGPLYIAGRRVIGYSKLTSDAPTNDNGSYDRRIFYLKDKDDPVHGERIPNRAVDPRSILPGVPGTTLSGSGENEMVRSS